jgi:hypothetical protein
MKNKQSRFPRIVFLLLIGFALGYFATDIYARAVAHFAS